MTDVRRVVCYRFDDERAQSYYTVHEIPYDPEMTVMGMLDRVTAEADPGFAHLIHSRCNQGYCARCVMKVNGKACLACNETTEAPVVVIEPVDKKKMSKDMAPRP